MPKMNVHVFDAPQDVGGGPRGTLRASMRMPVVDLQGREVMRSVSVGVSHYETLESAQRLIVSAREANSGHHINARFCVKL